MLVAAVFVAGIAIGRGSEKDPIDSEDREKTRSDDYPPGGNYIPPVSVQVIGTLTEVEGWKGTCVLDVIAVRDYTDSGALRELDGEEFRYAGELTVYLADGSAWDFTPGESLSFTYLWKGGRREPAKGGRYVVFGV